MRAQSIYANDYAARERVNGGVWLARLLDKMSGRREQRERERKRATANCQKLDSFLPLAKRQTPQCVETQTTSSAFYCC